MRIQSPIKTDCRK